MGNETKEHIIEGVGKFPQGMEMSVRTSWGESVTGKLLAASKEFVALTSVHSETYVVRAANIVAYKLGKLRMAGGTIPQIEQEIQDRQTPAVQTKNIGETSEPPALA